MKFEKWRREKCQWPPVRCFRPIAMSNVRSNHITWPWERDKLKFCPTCFSTLSHFVAGYLVLVWQAKQKNPSLMTITFLPPAKFETILFQGLTSKKKPCLPHEFLSCLEIQNKDIFKAGLICFVNIKVHLLNFILDFRPDILFDHLFTIFDLLKWLIMASFTCLYLTKCSIKSPLAWLKATLLRQKSSVK